ncbi:MAG: RNA polymerase sigma-70 factor [Runella sp.]
MSDDLLLQLTDDNSAEEAFEMIYAHYAQQLYRVAYQKTSSTQKAAEIVQDIFVSLWEKRQTLLIDNIEHYLLTSVRYQVINYLRVKIASRKFSDTDTEPLESGQLLDQSLNADELQQLLNQSLQQLPSKTRTIFEMSRYEQLSNKEIARQLELSEKAVEYHITQSIKHLRVCLKEFLPCLLLINL